MSSMKSERLVAANDDYKVVVCTQIPDHLAEELWEKNQTGFEELNANSVARQNMTLQEFFLDIASPKVHKYIVYTKSKSHGDADAAIGMLFVYADARDVNWINQSFMHEELPGFNLGKFCYISTLIIEQNHRKTAASALLVRSVGEDLKTNKQAIMDFAAANDRLPNFIQRIFDSDQFNGKALPVQIGRLGQENYLLVDPKKEELSQGSGPIEITTLIEPRQSEILWQQYAARTIGLDRRFPVRQTLNHDEFIAYCGDPGITKIVTTTQGLHREILFLSHSPQLVEHLSSEFIGAKSAGRKFTYLLGAGALDPIADNAGIKAGLRQALGISTDGHAVLAYNASEGADSLRRELAHLSGNEVIEIDHQSYWATRPRDDSTPWDRT